MRLKELLCVCGIMLMAVGCKPTEKGYKDAYDAAKAKREYVDPDEALLTGGHRLLNDGASNWRAVGSDSLQIQHIAIHPENGEAWPQAGPYRLAVAMFKMTTNARSMLNDMKGKGTLRPVVATDGKDRYFIVAGSASKVDSLAPVLAEFKRLNPGFSYIGLTPTAPLIIVSR